MSGAIKQIINEMPQIKPNDRRLSPHHLLIAFNDNAMGCLVG